MAKKKELLALDTPRRRSKRLMKLKGDDDQPEEFHQQPDPPSSSTDFPSSYGKSAGNGSDNLEALAKDVFKNMRSSLVNSPGDVSKLTASVEQETEMLLLETVKTPCKKIQM